MAICELAREIKTPSKLAVQDLEVHEAADRMDSVGNGQRKEKKARSEVRRLDQWTHNAHEAILP
jgi:hypothetical protein